MKIKSKLKVFVNMVWVVFGNGEAVLEVMYGVPILILLTHRKV